MSHLPAHFGADLRLRLAPFIAPKCAKRADRRRDRRDCGHLSTAHKIQQLHSPSACKCACVRARLRERERERVTSLLPSDASNVLEETTWWVYPCVPRVTSRAALLLVDDEDAGEEAGAGGRRGGGSRSRSRRRRGEEEEEEKEKAPRLVASICPASWCAVSGGGSSEWPGPPSPSSAFTSLPPEARGRQTGWQAGRQMDGRTERLSVGHAEGGTSGRRRGRAA